MPIIEVNHVTKEYQLGQIKSLKTTALNQWRRLTGQPVEERAPFKALDDINFKVEQGEVLGIIGHNGAGKSTMLKLLANISKPSSGSVTIKGKVAPLIEVGAGLVGDLTGRENIYLNGAILGIPKSEINSKFDDIVAFAELEEFIDTPIKRYSSGMQVRLGFSIATSVESDILIVDEVLAVGDLAFQRKCFDRMEGLIKKQGKTVLIVSHNVRQLEQICTRMIMLEKGEILLDSSPAEVSSLFFLKSNQKIQQQSSERVITEAIAEDEIEFVGCEVLDQTGNPSSHIEYQSPCTIRCQFRALRPLSKIVFFIGLHTTDFVHVTANETFLVPQNLLPGSHTFELQINAMALLPSVYAVRIWIGQIEGQVKFSAKNLSSFQVVTEDFGVARQQDAGFIELPGKWSFSTDTSNEEQQNA